MSYFQTSGGEEFLLASVVLVDPLVGDIDRGYYNVHLSGGQHVSLKELDISRDSFISLWKSIAT